MTKQTQPKSTGKTKPDVSAFYEVLWSEKIEITDVIDVLEMLRNGWLRYELTETDLAEIAYIFDVAKCNGELDSNGLPRCVDVYIAGLLRKLYNILDRINEMIEQIERGGGS